ncbi:MarR family transcriptional regulator [Actinokineospora sp. NBRC 105648]|uniref:MarR family winged helix-turn-helix transcriptional regulator n=1 Tax=Actinokineospora sp. NBRC 105648 TaxID=3032206 RepID=UPI0024A609A6|nr:MarR family transcriptional regulator [Actinokineospora sp. NBRC 105648]GLZ36974.1 MarR family transcriptional regulator [Actinokineospora sp. NBRC 105648]
MSGDTDAVSSWPTGRLLSVAARLVEHSWQEFLAARGLTHAGLITLHLLADGPRAQRALAHGAKVTDQTMSRTVERLARAGFVERETDPVDRRRTLVATTEAGRAVHREALRAEREDPQVLGAVRDYEAFRLQLVDLITALGVGGAAAVRAPDTED